MREKKHKVLVEGNSLYIETRQFCIFSEDGVAVAQARIDIPSTESRGIAAEYFRKLSQAQEKYVNASLGQSAKEEYEADADPRKRFLFKKYRYTAKIDITYQNDECISIFTEAKLTRGGVLLSVGRKGIIFSAGGMIPSIEFGVRKLPADEVILLNSDAVPCRHKYGIGDVCTVLPIKIKKRDKRKRNGHI